MITEITNSATYHFDVRADNTTYRTSFTMIPGGVEMVCTCNKDTDRHCWHINYVLTGKHQRIVNNKYDQADMLVEINKTEYGRTLHAKATGELITIEACRRCSSSNVILLKGSFYGKLIAMLKPDGRSFYCKSCKWSW